MNKVQLMSLYTKHYSKPQTSYMYILIFTILGGTGCQVKGLGDINLKQLIMKSSIIYVSQRPRAALSFIGMGQENTLIETKDLVSTRPSIRIDL